MGKANKEIAQSISEFHLKADCSCAQDEKCRVCSLKDDILDELELRDKALSRNLKVVLAAQKAYEFLRHGPEGPGAPPDWGSIILATQELNKALADFEAVK